MLNDTWHGWAWALLFGQTFPELCVCNKHEPDLHSGSLRLPQTDSGVRTGAEQSSCADPPHPHISTAHRHRSCTFDVPEPSPQCHKTFTAPSIRSEVTWHWTSLHKGARIQANSLQDRQRLEWAGQGAVPVGSAAPGLLSVCLSVCAIPSLLCSSTHSSGSAAPQALGTSGLASQGHQRFLCLWRALLLEDVSGFVLIMAKQSSAAVFQATHCLWGERNLKNSLIYHVKKRWHIYCYINVIYIVFSVTLTEIFWTSCCWLERFISNTLKFDTGYKSAINQQWKLENKMRSNSSRTISSYNTP